MSTFFFFGVGVDERRAEPSFGASGVHYGNIRQGVVVSGLQIRGRPTYMNVPSKAHDLYKHTVHKAMGQGTSLTAHQRRRMPAQPTFKYVGSYLGFDVKCVCQINHFDCIVFDGNSKTSSYKEKCC